MEIPNNNLPIYLQQYNVRIVNLGYTYNDDGSMKVST